MREAWALETLSSAPELSRLSARICTFALVYVKPLQPDLHTGMTIPRDTRISFFNGDGVALCLDVLDTELFS